MDSLDLALSSGKTVKVMIRFSARARNIRLRLAAKGPELVIPEGCPTKTAILFLQSQASWLETNLRSHPVRPVQRPESLELAFTGEKLAVEYVQQDVVWTGVRYSGPDSLLVSGNTVDDSDCITALRNWLVRKAVVELRPFAADVCSELGFTVSEFSIGLQRRVWGTCTVKRKVSLNSALLFFPKEIARYVIIHEGCHLWEMNHSVRFWNLVKKYYPYPEHARRVLNGKNSLPAWVHAETEQK